ncbi:phage tail assembly chaperone [Sphingobium sufflavum]|uniref:phage tail assembly chaperone n=1 Tax=Sphingobium sufflavum TaxID=1129547 RepID=UPI001F359463|nr:phage tail assembly chaperone [Sphingobium sufflavum]MCE7798646.1 phage tail assembly chaperone [Sphingobium sufflavum]
MTFGEQAGRLMALAAVLLGWRPAEFWAATPGELAAILRGLSEQAGGGVSGVAGMDAGALARLKEICPDDG